MVTVIEPTVHFFQNFGTITGTKTKESEPLMHV